MQFLLNLSEIVNIIVISTIIVLALILLGFYAWFQIFKKLHQSNNYQELIDKSIVFYYKEKKFIVFNKKYLTKYQEFTWDEFFKYFDNNSKKKFDSYINKLIENTSDDISKICEVDTLLKEGSFIYYFSVFEVSSINFDDQIIHLNQYIFQNIPLLNYFDLKKEEKIRNSFDAKDNVISTKFKNSSTYKGVSFIFKTTLINYYNKSSIETIIYYTIRNILSKYVIGSRIYVCEDKNTFIIHDFKISRTMDTLKLINNVRYDFNKFLELNGFTDRVKLSIGAVEHKYFPRSYTKTLKGLKQVINECQLKERNYVIYDNQQKSEFFFDQSYKNEVESIINNHFLKYSYSPIINTSNFAVLGYFSKITPISSIFTDINEIKDYAYKLNLDKDLFSEITKHVSSKFMNEIGNDKEAYLFYDLRFNELSYANSLLGYFTSFKSINSVLVFKEDDLLKNVDLNDQYVELIKKITSKGYKVGLEIVYKNLELPETVYALFDFFIFDSIVFEEKYNDLSHSSISLRKSIEKILKYKKKVIIKSVDNWSNVELRMQENLKLISGNAIAPFAEMITPISKKSIDKIKRIKKKGL